MRTHEGRALTGERSGVGGLDDRFSNGNGNNGSDTPAMRRDEGDGAMRGGVVDDVRELGAHFPGAEVLRGVGHGSSVPMRNHEYTGVHTCHQEVRMGRTLPAHGTCHHKSYRMTCDQHEALIAESEGECMACAKRVAHEPLGKLVIDHDYSYGPWAVRGLICSACNSLFLRDETGPNWAQPYLTDPWFLRELARLGLSPELPDEPSRDSYLRDFDNHIWFFEGETWRWTWSRSPLLSWRELFYKFGPAGLTPTTEEAFKAARGYRAYRARLANRARWQPGD